jgi:omega-6 fatty acid desaturase (delta-12 desaturase)
MPAGLRGRELPPFLSKFQEPCLQDLRPPSAAPLSHPDLRRLRQAIAEYAQPDTRRAVVQLLNTALPFCLLVGVVLWAVENGAWWAAFLALPGAALLVRLFMIQHDCGHGSFLRSRRANDMVGRLIGVLTLTPYAFWRKSHAIHHATSGHLDRRGTGDVTTLTVNEYNALSRFARLGYRLYRHPLVFFGLGPVYMFVLKHRIPLTHPIRDWKTWGSILGTNAALAGLMLALGADTVLIGYLPLLLGAAAVGVWLFYVQHQFEDTYWAGRDSWNFHAAAFEGSSYYDLPKPLRWITANIGFHHLHHLCSTIPNYRLRDCFERHPELRRARRLTLLASLRSASLALWDEQHRKLISFREAARRTAAAAAQPLVPAVETGPA